MQQILLQNATAIVLQNASVPSLQNATLLLQNVRVITKCDNFITKCDSYFKMPRLLQNALVQNGINVTSFGVNSKDSRHSEKMIVFMVLTERTKKIGDNQGEPAIRYNANNLKEKI